MTNDNKNVVVNESCIGCGACVAICSDIFDLNEEGKAFVKNGVNFDVCDCLDDAISACPVEAIEKQ